MSEKILIGKVKSIKECGFDETWLQNQIYENPSILGLGELEVVRREKRQPLGGRMDFLLTNPEDDSMYEVEIMLGPTDESHIIRTIEYWDNEKKRWPKRQHYAVLVAEMITRRFFNVISILSLNIPLIAIQVNIIEANGQKILYFNKILDIYEEPEEEKEEEIINEEYWKKKSPWTIENARLFKEIVDKCQKNSILKYAKHYIAITIGNYNYFLFHKRSGGKSLFRFWVNEKFIDELKNILDEKDIDYRIRDKEIRFNLNKDDILENQDLFQEIIKRVKESWEE